MPTTYSDQFFVMDPGNPPSNGTALTVQVYDFVDGNDNGFINPSDTGDTANGADVTRVWVGDTITVVMDGVTQTITGVTFYLSGQPAIFTPTDGTVLSDATFVSSTYVTTSTQIAVGDFGPPCFTSGTMIDTPDGPRRVEDIRPGDLVTTLDSGPQTVRWVGKRTVDGGGDFAPILFAPGALDNTTALLVSPQHRMLVDGWKAELFYGEDSVLVAAKHLVNNDTVTVAPCAEVTYVHILFDTHEVVMADGAPAESFFPGDFMLSRDVELRAEMLKIFPELATEGVANLPCTARRVLTGREAALLRMQVTPHQTIAA
ncbi:MAG: Hint domain-containing protein [Brevirhabdus sp.]